MNSKRPKAGFAKDTEDSALAHAERHAVAAPQVRCSRQPAPARASRTRRAEHGTCALHQTPDGNWRMNHIVPLLLIRPAVSALPSDIYGMSIESTAEVLSAVLDALAVFFPSLGDGPARSALIPLAVLAGQWLLGWHRDPEAQRRLRLRLRTALLLGMLYTADPAAGWEGIRRTGRGGEFFTPERRAVSSTPLDARCAAGVTIQNDYGFRRIHHSSPASAGPRAGSCPASGALVAPMTTTNLSQALALLPFLLPHAKPLLLWLGLDEDGYSALESAVKLLSGLQPLIQRLLARRPRPAAGRGHGGVRPARAHVVGSEELPRRGLGGRALTSAERS